MHYAQMCEYSMSPSAYAGVSKNSNQLSLGIGQITPAHRMSYGSGGDIANCGGSAFLAAVGGVLRPHTETWNNNPGPNNSFTVGRISN